MKEKLSLNISMFRSTEPGSLNPHLEGLLHTLGGDSWDLMKEDQSRGKLDESRDYVYRSAIDNYFYEVLRDKLNLGRADMQTYFEGQQVVARDVIEDIIKKYTPGLSTTHGLANEVSLLCRPGEIFSFLARSSEISNVLRFEVTRHLLTSLTVAQHHAHSANGQLRYILSGAQSLMNKHLYAGPEGQTQTHHQYIVFDNETNSPLGVYNPGNLVNQGQHIKAFIANIRTLKPDGCNHSIKDKELFTDTRVKKPTPSFMKIVAKALLNGGELKVDGDVRDNMGMMMTVYGDQHDRDHLLERLHHVYSLHPNGIDRIEEDNKTEGDRGQAKVQFKRMQVFLNGTEYPIEVMAYALLDYLRSRYEVGRINPSTGMYDGAAHSLYEFRRSIPVTGLLFPAEIYGVDSRTTIIHHMNQTAEDLRFRDRVRIPN